MNGEERRKKIIYMLQKGGSPVPGLTLAKTLNVSRQVIVQDIALLRAQEVEIQSTNRGYRIVQPETIQRVFKVHHSDVETKEELQLIIDLGGTVEDVFVYHKTYEIIRGELNLRSRYEIDQYMQDISEGKSSLLKNVTSGYHYHTVTASSVEILDRIQDALNKRGFLAPLMDYEPVNFWAENE